MYAFFIGRKIAILESVVHKIRQRWAFLFLFLSHKNLQNPINSECILQKKKLVKGKVSKNVQKLVSKEYHISFPESIKLPFRNVFLIHLCHLGTTSQYGG